MQFCNDEKFLGTGEMTRDVNGQFKQTVLIFNERHISPFSCIDLTLDFLIGSKACFGLLLASIFWISIETVF